MQKIRRNREIRSWKRRSKGLRGKDGNGKSGDRKGKKEGIGAIGRHQKGSHNRRKIRSSRWA